MDDIAAFDEAIRTHQLYSVFQPLVELPSGKIFAYEALVRSKEERFKSPPFLFETAIKAKRCGELGRRLRAIAIEAAAGWPLFLNIHPNEFDEGWLVRPDDPIFQHQEPVYIEITETVPITHFAFCHGLLKEIRGKGIFLAVDDLGAGYSNLRYIADLSPEIVKLDRALITGLSRDKRLFSLVKSIVSLCITMGAKVVAEGIETYDELSAVLDTGAHYGQGFFLARPGYPLPRVNSSLIPKKIK
ncbi:MAG: EAL domain-containing protein [Myxococcales bacterium]|nr:MAG: EAL domain-containing protein [Myxococcales bacterium]